ncbi:Cna B-type domain-containing protein [Oceanobacillus alkalisoli]|uniref:Cna B-type domain-containing protein n=1 Tax=Oceanobacillus alkalisoli TaxID=2925113 RepID=UPI001EE4986C|nr:Cna B-type domain-containing protein [Oceanobacillus alkalisoli]MCG5102781.1 Cna B-type domain-containing protein [Oceanobacillus alkalisoli]
MSRKMGSRISVLFAVMLLFQTLLSSFAYPSQIFAAGYNDSVFTGISAEETGEQQDTEDGTVDLVDVQINWSIEHLEIKPGNTDSLQLSEDLSIEADQTGRLLTEEGVDIGEYTASINNTVMVTFEEATEEYPDSKGVFVVEATQPHPESEAQQEDNSDEAAETEGDKESAAENDEEALDEEDVSEEEEPVTEEEAPEDEEEAVEEDETAEDEETFNTASEHEEPQQITENIIDDLRLIREDGSIYEEGDFLDLDEDLRLELDWSLPNGHEYQEGDTFEFQLPDALTIYNDFDGDLDGYGMYRVTTDGLVTFTFSEKIENESDIKGTFWTDTELNEQVVKKTTDELELIFNDEVIKKITINVKPKGGQAIQKNGQPVNGNFNTEEIEWSVIVNTTREALENAVVTDPILDGQKLILDSIDVKEVEVNLEGHVEEVLDGDVSFTDNSSEEELNLHFGDTDKAYQITFRTKMTEEEKDKEGWTEYSNTAFLNSDGKDEAQSGASVSVQRPESLTKTASDFNKGDRSVEWTVNANFTEKELSAGSEIVDEFTFTIGDKDRSDAFEITLADIDIQQVDSFGDNGAVGKTSDAKDLFDITIEGNKVTYKLKDASNKAFIIKYKTTAKEGAYINDDGTISNTVGIDGKTATSSQGVGQQVGVKTNSGINYEDKTIDWTITVNADRQELRNFVLTDDFSDTGQKLVDGSIKVDPGVSEDAIVPNEDGEGFVINFGDINEPYTITYQTEFTYDFGGTDEKPSFRNGVHVSYTTTDGVDYDLEFGDNVNPNEETRSNGAKNSSVNNKTKEITWMIDINYNQLTLDDAKLIDEIADNQSLVDGSVAIYPTTISDNGTIKVGENAIEDFDVNIIKNDDGNKEINIDFRSIDQSYRVVFITKDKDGIYNSNEVYENKAQFIPREGEVHNLKANATLPNQGEFLEKNGLHNRDEWTIDWELTVNESKSTLTDATVTDNLGDESLQILLEESIKVAKVGSDDVLVAGEDYELVVDGNELSVKFPGVITDTYSINYSAYILAAETADISNEAAIKSVEDTIVGNVESEETVQVRISTGGGSGEGTTGELILEKVESDTNRPLENVAFTLKRTIGNQEITVREDTTDEDGKIHWTGLQFGDYTLEEVIPEGYLGEESQEITLSSDAPEGIQTITIENERQTGTAEIEKVDAVTGDKLEDAEFKITNLVTGQTYTLTTDEDGKISEEVPFGEYTVEEITAPNGYRITEDIENITIEIDKTTAIEVTNHAITEVSGEKVWEDANNQDGIRPVSITVNLLADGEKKDSVEITEEDDWHYRFTNLPVYDENNEEIIYTVEEEPNAEIEVYETEVNGFDITNSYTPEETSLTVTKLWDDGSNQDGNRPDSISVQLYADDDAVGDPITLEGPYWSYTWTELAVYDNGSPIEYTVQELNVPKEYEVSVSNETQEYIVITNSYEPETTEIAVNKVWNDEENQDNVRPNNVTVNLLADGEIERQTVLNKDNEWQYLFTDLPVYEDGREIKYTITEDAVTHYSTDVESTGTEEEPAYTITNNYTPEETSVTVTKSWDDDNNRDGNRPTEIQLQLLANGEPHGDFVTVDQSDWTYTWSNLPANKNGEPIEYTVEEVDVPEGYTESVNDNDHGNIIITNSYEPETTEIAVNKEWDDADNQDGNRPSGVTVNLLGNGEVVKTTVLDEENEWNHTFTNLPVYENGEKITYRVTENNVEGYTPDIKSDPNNENGFVITNSYTPEETSVTVTKGWNDVNNQDNKRPESIDVQLTADGEAIGDTQTLSEENNWTYTWDELDLNADGKPIDYSVEEVNVPEGYTSSINDNDHGNIIITNNYTPEVTEIPVKKIWDDDDDRDRVRPNNVTVTLLADGEIERQAVLNEAGDWEHTFKNLPVYENGTKINYSLTENTVLEYSTSVQPDENGFVVTNSYTPDETTATVTKNWNDAENQDGVRPESIEVQLLANDEPTGAPVEIHAEDGWTYTWEGLPLNADGEPIKYSVEELNVPEGYEMTVNDEDHGNLILTNNHTPEEINISGTKTWDDADNQDGIRPTTITVNLFANDDFVKSVDVTEADDWSYNFNNLPKYEAGEEITYTITEDEVEGYETEIDGFDITNTHTPEVIDVNGTKTWDDADNQDGIRPDTITVNLLADGEQVASTNVTEEDNWSYSFTDLPKFEAGEEIVYTITENTVEDYTQTIDGFDITNEYTPGETAVTVTKDWDDANNQDGIRPETIEVQLTADGDDQGEPVELSEDNNWTHTWTELDEKAAGESIVYSVVEVTELPEYETSVNDENHGNIIITNSYTPETTEVAGTKTWDDADNQDGIRPESITVNLLSNGNSIKSVEVTAEEDWSYQFNNLPKYEAGEEIAYTITEDAVEGYEASVDGFDLTNTHTPEVIELNGTKTWDDADNQDGIRPASITVNLHANGDEEAIDSVEVTADDNWEYSFDNLPKFEAGEKITYTITEDVVEGYNTIINGFNITNSYTPETTEVAGTKTWDDADNQDGIRPASITVNLVANDEKVDSVDVTEETNWSYHFDNLPKYEAGEEIVYTITEQPVEGYDTIINGFNITNSHTPELTEVTGTKTWNDGDNQDGIRPDSITVNLLANGEPVDSVVVSAEDNWNYSFTDLPKYENGKEIKYTVTENTVKDYSQEINGYDITNHYTPGETAVTVTKHWDDAANQDGKRLEVIEVQLTANGDPVGDPVELSEANNWTHTWTELDEKAAGEAIVYSVEELTEVPEYDTEINDENHGSIVITNSYTPEVIEVSGEKTWKDANNQDGIRPDSIMVNLLANGEPVDSVEVSAEDDWSYSFIDLPKYENGKEIKYTITENTVTDYSQEIDRYDITNHYTPGETAVSVTKHWDDAGNQDGKRLDAIEVQLTANGDPVGDPVKLSEENNWTYTWTELDEKAAGETIIYSVIELTEVPEYDTAVNDADHGNIIITNAYTPEVIEVSGEKTWDDADNQDGIRPDTITVNLYGDGEFIASVEVTEADDWRYSFTDLPKYSEGTEIEYTITEVPVEGYETEISGFDITNIHEPEVVDVSGTKTWNDENDQDGVRPDSITVNLLANGELVDSIEVTAENDWSYEFSDLPKYENGVEIKYTITENTVADYSQEIDGYDITNHYTPGETAVTVTKQWDDANNQDGKRLDAIEVQLTANDDPIGDPVELSAANNWTYTWTALDEKAAGETIVYSVIELTEAADYVTEINDENHGNIIITNSYTPETMDISGEKTWLDGDNETNDRPEEITVNLLANGEVLTSTNVTEADDWSYQFTDLPKYSAGEEITYTVEEVPVEGYETIIDGYNMTNLRVGTIDVEGVKTWVGDSEEVRPESITVHLLQNDVVIDTEEVTVADDWKYSFTDLPAFDEVGAAYVYTIEEEAVEGYETTINSYNITNTYTVEVDEGGEDPTSGDEKDKDKTPSTPVDKEDTETLAGVDSKDLDPGKGSKLPKTATNIFNLLAIGIALIVLAIAITIYRRRKAA